MLGTNWGVTNDPAVNNALDSIESGLKVAFEIAIGRLNCVLEGRPTDTHVLHANLADLHKAVAQIDRNTEQRAREHARVN